MTAAMWFERLERVVCAILVVLFVGYFGLHCFRYEWVGDIHRHTASVASVYRDLLHPRHESMPFAGTASEVHTPYILAIAVVGRALGVTPYRALQLTGVANLILYVAAVFVFFRTFSIARRSWIPPVAFLMVSLLLRERVFSWASETALPTLRLIQAYPSMFGWAVALLIFSGVERYLETGTRWLLAVLGLAFSVLLLSHNLTAAWATLITGVRGVTVFATGDRSTRLRAVILGFAVAAGLGAAWFWPYFDIAQSANLRLYPEGSMFGDRPFRDMARMYALALVAAVWFLMRRVHGVLLIGFIATFLALEVFRVADYSYGNRFAFFQAFFAQALVAEAVTVGVFVACGQRARLHAALASAPEALHLGPIVAATALACAVTSPLFAAESLGGRPLLGWRALWSSPSSHDAYYATFGGLRDRLSPTDIVLTPLGSITWDVPAITGAPVVVSEFAYRVPDYPTRIADVTEFFQRDCGRTERTKILARYHVTKVLLPPEHATLASELGSQWPMTGSANGFLLFDVATAAEAPAVARLATQ